MPRNNGWMSRLEVAAQRVLTPLILGKSGTIALEDQAVIAMWAQKTALTAMLISSEEQRDGGYGLPQAEYSALYKHRARMQPLDRSRFWVGRYEGPGEYSAIRVMPLAVRVEGTPEPDLPAGYALTIVLGELVLHGGAVHLASLGNRRDNGSGDATTMAVGCRCSGRRVSHALT